jgi:IS5 family transposase
MLIQTNTQMHFSDLAVSKRKIDMTFFDNINKIVDWNKIETLLKKYYNKGHSADGRPAYEGILLFKITLLQTWFKLSDEAVEERINDSIKFTKFLGLSLEECVPDHSVISRFRKAMSEKNALKKVLGELNRQLTKHKIIIKTGVLVDASVTQSPYTPSQPTTFEIANDRDEDARADAQTEKEEIYHKQLTKLEDNGTDTEARWLKKGKKSYYGYKKHTATNEDGLILGIETTTANQSDTKHFIPLVKKLKLKKGTRIKADKGYSSKSNKEFLKENRLKSGIQYKAVRGKELITREKQFNKIVSKTRYAVERTFGSIKKWFNGGTAKYKGLAKIDYQHQLEAIAYNLYRSPGLVYANARK